MNTQIVISDEDLAFIRSLGLNRPADVAAAVSGHWFTGATADRLAAIHCRTLEYTFQLFGNA